LRDVSNPLSGSSFFLWNDRHAVLQGPGAIR